MKISGGKRNVELCVISIQVKRSRRIRQDISKRSSVETEKQWAENRALRNTSRDGSRGRKMRIDRNGIRAIVKIERKKGECRTRYAKVGGESGEKNMMINSIEDRREIKKNKSRDLLLVNGEEEIVVDAKKSGLSRMELAIGRLKRGKRRKRVEMVDKASVDDALENFETKIEVRNGAVAGEIINRKGVFCGGE